MYPPTPTHRARVRVAVSLASFLCLSAAAGDAAAQTNYLSSLSEESGRNSRSCPDPRQSVFAIECSGSYCDNVYLGCSTTSNVFPTAPTGATRRTVWVESGGETTALCGDGQYAVGMECRGSHCDDVRLICRDSGYSHSGCHWSGTYSDEQGWYFDWNKGLAGVRCSGQHCDNKRYYMCGRSSTLRPAELRVTLRTGGDDLRGGNDNLDIGVRVDGQVRYWFRNVNGGHSWANYSSHTVTLRENAAFRAADVEGLTLRTTSGGGTGGDNWNLDSVTVDYDDQGSTSRRYSSPYGLVHRFTGELPEHTFFWAGNYLRVTLWTGSDDLRGGDDNVNLYVIYTNGQRVRFPNVNRSGTWQNNLSQTVYLALPETYTSIADLAAVGGVFVETTVTGGVGGDNWNLDRIRVTGQIDGNSSLLFDQSGGPVVRFSGSRRQHLFSWRSIAPSGRVMTSFRPYWDGFNFNNGFKESYFVSLVQNSGFCGGISYAALDHFYAGLTPPYQNFRPAPGTPLREYIYERQELSLTGGSLDQWTELSFNPFGWRNYEFFSWGLQFGSGRLGQLIAHIDAGQPVPLGLRSCGSSCSSDHQVVAYGYELGRYYGNIDSTVDDIKIFIYDPNDPDKEAVLQPNRTTWRWKSTEDPDPWLAYFVDSDYFGGIRTPPPVTNFGSIILLEIETGEDDLRRNDLGHGGESFDVVLRTTTGRTHRFFGAFGGGPEEELLSRSTEYLPLDISGLHADFGSHLASVEIVTNFAGGVAGENWDLAQLSVRSQIAWSDCRLPVSSPGPFRFTGSAHARTYAVGSPVDCIFRMTPRADTWP